MQHLNTMKIEDILTIQQDPNFQIGNQILYQLNNAKSDFEDYIAKNVYGKKQHSYKIPNTEELQKLL